VLLVATATLAGFLAVDAIGAVALPGQEYAGAAPLRASARERTGRVGGLLSPATLHGRSGSMQSRDLRPAVVMLVQYPCECLARLKHVAVQADGSKVRVYVVGFHGRAQVDRLAQGAGRGVVPLVDAQDRLHQAYHRGPDAILLLVRRDGVVTEIVDGVPANMDLASRLPALLTVP
jgi:hypothetical protein